MLTFSDTVHARSAAAITDLQNGAWREGKALQALSVIMLTGRASIVSQDIILLLKMCLLRGLHHSMYHQDAGNLQQWPSLSPLFCIVASF